jgi:molybdate transport system regulatory protein
MNNLLCCAKIIKSHLSLEERFKTNHNINAMSEESRKPENRIYAFGGRIWITVGNEAFIGQGRIDLICKIKELGSLRKAAIEMKMSYRKAWYDLDKINSMADRPLVILKRGGKYGGIAEITDLGEKIVSAYKEIKIEFDEFLKNKSQEFDPLGIK